LALALVLTRYFYHVHQQHEAMDVYLDERLTQPLVVPLDCPPLGRQMVTFLPSETDPETIAEDAPLIQKNWSRIWPDVYNGILTETNDWKAEEKLKLSDKVEIKVNMPSKSLEKNPDWQIEYDCAAGYFTTAMNGYTARQTQIGN